MDEPLSERQLQLLIALREVERSGKVVDFAKLAKATGYSESSVRTYFTKRLDGFLAFRDEEGWRIRGATRTSEESFAKRLSQKAGSANEALRSEASWRALVRKLLYEGQRRHYTLGREELDLIEGLGEARDELRERLATDELDVQPSLFGR
jgi:hypothetical protein